MKPSVPDSNRTKYIAAVLALYLGLPETPLCANAQDHAYARQLHDRGVPMRVVESAFLLASLRRLIRPPEAPPLSPIRSLAYFHPVVEELLANPAPENYLEYLRLKLRHMTDTKTAPQGHPANVPRNTNPR